jgi:hypothetical protein
MHIAQVPIGTDVKLETGKKVREVIEVRTYILETVIM